MATTRLERLRGQIQQVLAPAKSDYEALGLEIEQKLDELSDLRRQQGEIRRLIRSLEPDFDRVVRTNGEPRAKLSRRTADKYSAGKIDQTYDWLAANAATLNGNDGFYASEIVKMPGCPVRGQSGMSAVLMALHEQGRVRLTKRSGIGGRKYFKVVA